MSKIIYIVDDQPGVLTILGILLRRFDPAWKVIEFSDPLKVIEAVEREQPHLVLTDQTMPGMLGSQMLEQIRERSPQTVRILISGHIVRLDKITSAHQYLTKPFDNKELTATIRHALVAQESLGNPKLARLVASLRSFPVLPGAYAKLIHDLDEDTAPTESVIELLNQDAGALSRILQVANSPLFRGPSPVTQASEALFQLGTGLTKALVLSLHVFEKFEHLNFSEMPLDALWHHSLETAQIAQTLCRSKLSEDAANDAFFAGLVHDLGRLILVENEPDAYHQICRDALASKRPLSAVEREKFGCTHAELAAFLLRLWGLSRTIVDAVTNSETAPENPDDPQLTVASAVYWANIFSRQRNPPDQFVTPEIDQATWTNLGLEELSRQQL